MIQVGYNRVLFNIIHSGGLTEIDKQRINSSEYNLSLAITLQNGQKKFTEELEDYNFNKIFSYTNSNSNNKLSLWAKESLTKPFPIETVIKSQSSYRRYEISGFAGCCGAFVLIVHNNFNETSFFNYYIKGNRRKVYGNLLLVVFNKDSDKELIQKFTQWKFHNLIEFKQTESSYILMGRVI